MDNITLRYCQTEHMLADFLSKPLQGSLFRKFRDVLLGLAHVSSLRVPVALLGEERVIGHVNDPNQDTRESRLGVRGCIRVELDQH